ncbi:hypothetical protein [Candidatus Burkholderia verschuerenii]|nr:hypothetical protein [Candidatus Burkholderia verschuerenii]
MDDASDENLERALKDIPTLVVQMLRLANSGGNCRTRSAAITSVKQAMSVVGHKQLVRWCCLLLYGDGLNNAAGIDPLLSLVERRSTFMECAANEYRARDPEFSQSAWLAGLLSLAHIPNGVGPEEFIGELPISPLIQEAIIARGGELGRLLSLAEEVEAGRFDAAAAIGSDMGLELVA